MGKLMVIKSISGNYTDIILKSRDGKSLTIINSDNLNFVLKNYKENPTFIISREDKEIYEIFDTLFKNVMNAEFPITKIEIDELEEECSIYNRNYEEEYKKLLVDRKRYIERQKKSRNYQLLTKDGIIEWKCDYNSFEEAPSFTIEPKDDSYVVSFFEGKNSLNEVSGINVIVSGSGSKYNPFHLLFYDLYNSLCMIGKEKEESKENVKIFK